MLQVNPSRRCTASQVGDLIPNNHCWFVLAFYCLRSLNSIIIQLWIYNYDVIVLQTGVLSFRQYSDESRKVVIEFGILASANSIWQVVIFSIEFRFALFLSRKCRLCRMSTSQTALRLPRRDSWNFRCVRCDRVTGSQSLPSIWWTASCPRRSRAMATHVGHARRHTRLTWCPNRRAVRRARQLRARARLAVAASGDLQALARAATSPRPRQSCRRLGARTTSRSTSRTACGVRCSRTDSPPAAAASRRSSRTARLAAPSTTRTLNRPPARSTPPPLTRRRSTHSTRPPPPACVFLTCSSEKLTKHSSCTRIWRIIQYERTQYSRLLAVSLYCSTIFVEHEYLGLEPYESKLWDGFGAQIGADRRDDWCSTTSHTRPHAWAPPRVIRSPDWSAGWTWARAARQTSHSPTLASSKFMKWTAHLSHHLTARFIRQYASFLILFICAPFRIYSPHAASLYALFTWILHTELFLRYTVFSYELIIFQPLSSSQWYEYILFLSTMLIHSYKVFYFYMISYN